MARSVVPPLSCSPLTGDLLSVSFLQDLDIDVFDQGLSPEQAEAVDLYSDRETGRMLDYGELFETIWSRTRLPCYDSIDPFVMDVVWDRWTREAFAVWGGIKISPSTTVAEVAVTMSLFQTACLAAEVLTPETVNRHDLLMGINQACYLADNLDWFFPDL